MVTEPSSASADAVKSYSSNAPAAMSSQASHPGMLPLMIYAGSGLTVNREDGAQAAV